MMIKPIRKSILSIMGLLCSIVPLSNAFAQEIEVGEDESFTHKASGVLFVPQVGELKRFRVNRYRSDNDLSATYEDESGDTFATLYVTRVGTPDPYLWFNVVLHLIRKREGFSPMMEPGVQPELFIAPGFEKDSGVQVTYAARGGKIRSTGLAIMAYDDFIVKVRVSSYELDRVKLGEKMKQFIAGFSMPTPTGNEIPSYTIQDCPDRLKFAPDSKQLEDGMAGSVTGTISELFGESLGGLGLSQYCLDSISDDGFRIYRPGASKLGYLLAYSDTGRSVIVGRGGQSGLDQLSTANEPSNYRIAHQLPDVSEIYAPFDKLPPPGTVARIIGETPVIATTDRDGTISMTAETE